MTSPAHVDAILHDCLFAVGQAVVGTKQLDYDAVVALHDRFREKFLHAIVVRGNSWEDDRDRVLAVGRYLGIRAAVHAKGNATISTEAVLMAASEVESGCRMRARRPRRG